MGKADDGRHILLVYDSVPGPSGRSAEQRARSVAEFLREKGHPVVLSAQEWPYADEAERNRLETGSIDALCVIVLLTERYWVWPFWWVREEIGRPTLAARKLIPVVLDDGFARGPHYTPEPPDLGDWVDLRGWEGEPHHPGLNALIERITELETREPTESQAPSSVAALPADFAFDAPWRRLGPMSARTKTIFLLLILAMLAWFVYEIRPGFHFPTPFPKGPPVTNGPPVTKGPPPDQGLRPGTPTNIPSFPWPPPAASAEEVFPNDALVRAALHFMGDDRSRYFYERYGYERYLRERYLRERDLRERGFLHDPPYPPLFLDIDTVLHLALESNGYFESSYYAVPDGFALVTRLEQIELDGSSKPDPPRWSVDPFATKGDGFSVLAYVRALFTAAPGYYRVIVFVVTPVPFGQSARTVTRSEALGWLRDGVRWLPERIAEQPYTRETRCSALIYEFECRTNASARLLLPSRLSSRAHLVKSGIWRRLTQ